MALAWYVITAPVTVPAAVTITCPPRRVATRWCDPPPDELRTFAERVRTGPIVSVALEGVSASADAVQSPLRGTFGSLRNVPDHEPFSQRTDSPFLQWYSNVPLRERYRTLGLPQTGHFARPFRIRPTAGGGVWFYQRWSSFVPTLVELRFPLRSWLHSISTGARHGTLTSGQQVSCIYVACGHEPHAVPTAHVSDPLCPLTCGCCSCKVPGSAENRSPRTRNCRT